MTAEPVPPFAAPADPAPVHLSAIGEPAVGEPVTTWTAAQIRQAGSPGGPAVTSRPAHFFDLGGTLLALDATGEIDYDDAGRATILPGVAERLAALAGELVFVVTNQCGLADGVLPRAIFDGFCAQLTAHTGGVITAYAVCAHPRDAGCRCRKPRRGLILDLAARYDIDLAASTLVGDSPVDRELARRCAIQTFHWADAYFAGPALGGPPPR